MTDQTDQTPHITKVPLNRTFLTTAAWNGMLLFFSKLVRDLEHDELLEAVRELAYDYDSMNRMVSDLTHHETEMALDAIGAGDGRFSTVLPIMEQQAKQAGDAVLSSLDAWMATVDPGVPTWMLHLIRFRTESQVDALAINSTKRTVGISVLRSHRLVEKLQECSAEELRAVCSAFFTVMSSFRDQASVIDDMRLTRYMQRNQVDQVVKENAAKGIEVGVTANAHLYNLAPELLDQFFNVSRSADDVMRPTVGNALDDAINAARGEIRSGRIPCPGCGQHHSPEDFETPSVVGDADLDAQFPELVADFTDQLGDIDLSSTDLGRTGIEFPNDL